MARKTTEVITDDIDGTPDARHYQFGYVDADGEWGFIEVDLAPHHADNFIDTLNEFIEAGRAVAHPPVPEPRKRGRQPGANAAHRERTAAVRAWAIEQGLISGTRGRIPTPVVEAYDAAH